MVMQSDPAASFARQLQGLIEVGRVLPPLSLAEAAPLQRKVEFGAAKERLHAYFGGVHFRGGQSLA